MEENRFTWNLEDIYPDEQAWYQDLSKAKGADSKAGCNAGKGLSGLDILWLEALDLSTKCSEYIAKLFTYVSCHYDAQMGNAGYKSCMKPSAERTAQLPSRLPFLMPELMERLAKASTGCVHRCRSLHCIPITSKTCSARRNTSSTSAANRCWCVCRTSTPPLRKSTPTCVSTTPRTREIADSQGNKLVVSDATYSAAMEHRTALSAKSF